MKLENAFEVEAELEQTWELLVDVPQIVPCMPGATLVATVDDTTWKAEVKVKLGPVGMVFAADVKREELDELDHSVVLRVRAKEKRGRGGASAVIRSGARGHDGGTHVTVTTDLDLTGAVAQFGGSMVGAVAAQMTADFAGCLQTKLAEAYRAPAPAQPAQADAPVGGEAVTTRPAAAAASPLSGFRLLLRALLSRWRGVTRP